MINAPHLIAGHSATDTVRNGGELGGARGSLAPPKREGAPLKADFEINRGSPKQSCIFVSHRLEMLSFCK